MKQDWLDHKNVKLGNWYKEVYSPILLLREKVTYASKKSGQKQRNSPFFFFLFTWLG